MTTIREHLGTAYQLSAHLCEHWGDQKPCPGCLCAKEIEAALAILDNAPRRYLASEGFIRRQVPDGNWPNPEPSA